MVWAYTAIYVYIHSRHLTLMVILLCIYVHMYVSVDSISLYCTYSHPFCCSAASPPLCPTLTDVTTDSLDVSWYPPNIHRGDITDYEVRRGERKQCRIFCPFT